MKMRVRIAVLGCLMLSALIMGATAVGRIGENGPIVTQNINNSQPSDLEGAAFYLREDAGFVAVFECGVSDEPILVTDIEVATLPDADREQLRSGVPAADKTEVLTLLEDFSS